jgi:hypothetical protein
MEKFGFSTNKKKIIFLNSCFKCNNSQTSWLQSGQSLVQWSLYVPPTGHYMYQHVEL